MSLFSDRALKEGPASVMQYCYTIFRAFPMEVISHSLLGERLSGFSDEDIHGVCGFSSGRSLQ